MATIQELISRNGPGVKIHQAEFKPGHYFVPFGQDKRGSWFGLDQDGDVDQGLAQGWNKWLLGPKPKEKKKIERFMWVRDDGHVMSNMFSEEEMKHEIESGNSSVTKYPFYKIPGTRMLFEVEDA